MLKAAVLLVAVPLALGACGGGGKPRPIESGNIAGLNAYLAGVGGASNEAQVQQASQRVVATGQQICAAHNGKLKSYAVDLAKTYRADEAVVIHYLCPWRAQDYAQVDQ
jgi:hypothetical protein